MNQTISFKVAWAAKAKGFNELCPYSWETENNCHETFRPWRNEEDPFEAACCDVETLNRWLRDAHSLDVKAIEDQGEWFYAVSIADGTTILSSKESSNKKPFFHSHEEAIDAGQLAALNSIKKVA